MDDLKLLENIKILYIEDEKVTRTMIFSFLKKRVGKVIAAECGEEGIRKFLEYKPDIIITDLVMPDMSGMEVMRRIRSMGYKVPIIITSALSDSKTILETMDLKIEKYLIKPIDEDILLEKLVNIASEELNIEKGLTLSEKFNLSNEAKKQMQMDIRNLYSKYLKKVTGKGARSIEVFIKGKEVEIICRDTLTVLEENLLCTSGLPKSIEIIRSTVYEHTREYLENELSNLIERKVKLKKISIYPEEKYERMVLKII